MKIQNELDQEILKHKAEGKANKEVFATFQNLVLKYLQESNDDDPGIFDPKFMGRIKRSKTYEKLERVFEKENLTSDLSQCLQLFFDGVPKNI